MAAVPSLAKTQRYVGEIAASNPRWIEAIWQLSGVPVLCSMALGFDGEYYNINADEMAAACAIACRADALVFLTDVPGVKGANGEVLRLALHRSDCGDGQSAVISGGMLPKLGACREALLNGVKRMPRSARRGCKFPARFVQLARSPRHRSDGCLRRFSNHETRRDSRRGSKTAAFHFTSGAPSSSSAAKVCISSMKMACAISICSAASVSMLLDTIIRRSWRRLPDDCIEH